MYAARGTREQLLRRIGTFDSLDGINYVAPGCMDCQHRHAFPAFNADPRSDMDGHQQRASPALGADSWSQEILPVGSLMEIDDPADNVRSLICSIFTYVMLNSDSAIL